MLQLHFGCRPLQRRIQILTSHPLVAGELHRILASRRDVRCLLAEPPAVAIEQLAASAEPLVLIVDICGPSADALRTLRTLRVRTPNAHFVVVVDPRRWTNTCLSELLHAGVEGVARSSGRLAEELLRAVCAVLEGEIWAPADVLARYVRQTNWAGTERMLEQFSLTARENQVLQFLVRRSSNREIAAALRITERTVKFHVSNLLAKFKAPDRRAVLNSIGPDVPEPHPSGLLSSRLL